MEDTHITFETAKLAKEKGFNIYTLTKFDYQGETESCDLKEFNFWVLEGGHYSRPTQTLLAKWLREEHNIHIEISNNTYEEDYEIILQEALKSI